MARDAVHRLLASDVALDKVAGVSMVAIKTFELDD
jgi:hypothetical protein